MLVKDDIIQFLQDDHLASCDMETEYSMSEIYSKSFQLSNECTNEHYNLYRSL